MAHDRGEPRPPPADLAIREVPLTDVVSTPWFRIHRTTFSACFYSEDPAHRFSNPGLGVLYLADAPITAFWEVFWDDLGTRAPDERRISRAKLNQRVVRTASLQRSLRVFDATNPRSLKAVSATAGTFSGGYSICKAWAKALHDHDSTPEGIAYRSTRHGDGRCLAMFAERTRCEDIAFGATTPLGASSDILRAVLADHVDVIED
jgi:hypothetical protein